jgi:hypothetical protein
MSDVTARITGKVLVTTKESFGSGEKAFRFTEARIQTGVASIEPVRFTDRWEFETPRAGDLLDLEVTISGFGGRNGVQVNATAVKPFDESYLLDLAAEKQAA